MISWILFSLDVGNQGTTLVPMPRVFNNQLTSDHSVSFELVLSKGAPSGSPDKRGITPGLIADERPRNGREAAKIKQLLFFAQITYSQSTRSVRLGGLECRGRIAAVRSVARNREFS